MANYPVGRALDWAASVRFLTGAELLYPLHEVSTQVLIS